MHPAAGTPLRAFSAILLSIPSFLCLPLRQLSCLREQVREDGAVEFVNEGRGARLRVFAALKHRFLTQVSTQPSVEAGCCSCVAQIAGPNSSHFTRPCNEIS